MIAVADADPMSARQNACAMGGGQTIAVGAVPPPEGSRGGIWVAMQVCAGFAVVAIGLVGPRPRRARRSRNVLAGLLAAAGAVAVVAARRDLGDAFTVFPRPRPGAPVADRGVYRLVRHPMYAGVMAQATAVGLAGSPWALLPAGALAVIFDRKAAGEEALLDAAHPGFSGYRDRTRWRFVPGIR